MENREFILLVTDDEKSFAMRLDSVVSLGLESPYTVTAVNGKANNLRQESADRLRKALDIGTPSR